MNRIPTDEQKIEHALRSLLGRVRCTNPDDASAILAKLGEVFDLFLASERDVMLAQGYRRIRCPAGHKYDLTPMYTGLVVKCGICGDDRITVETTTDHHRPEPPQ